MTTSFTAPIKLQGPVTHVKFADFALRCARGIDFASTQRHEPLETPLREETLDPALLDAVREAVMYLEEATELTAPQWDRDWREHNKRTLEAQLKLEREATALRARYEAMLADVEAWQPPTPEHFGLKNFMRDQLTESIEVDCCPNAIKPTTFDTADEYRDAEIHRLTSDLTYHRLQLHKAQLRVSHQNDWIRSLWASLAAHPHTTTALAAGEATS